MNRRSRTPASSNVKYKNPNIGFIGSLKKAPSPEHCLQMLYSLSHRVSKLMQQHKLKVGVLQEFCPKDDNLLGLNVNRGQKILLRLRNNNDPYMLMDEDMVLDTLLHELCHNNIGPHNDAFHKLWDEYRSEQYGNQALGLYNNFLGQGRKITDDQRTIIDNNLIAEKAKQKARVGRGRKLGTVSRGKSTQNSLLTPAEMARQAALERMQKFEEKSCSCNMNLDVDDDSDIEIIDMNDDNKIDKMIDQSDYLPAPKKKKVAAEEDDIKLIKKEKEVEVIILSD